MSHNHYTVLIQLGDKNKRNIAMEILDLGEWLTGYIGAARHVAGSGLEHGNHRNLCPDWARTWNFHPRSGDNGNLRWEDARIRPEHSYPDCFQMVARCDHFNMKKTGIGGGSVGRVVASDSRGPRFESSHWQKLYLTLLTVNFIEKTEIKKKRPGIAIEKRDR